MASAKAESEIQEERRCGFGRPAGKVGLEVTTKGIRTGTRSQSGVKTFRF